MQNISSKGTEDIKEGFIAKYFLSFAWKKSEFLFFYESFYEGYDSNSVWQLTKQKLWSPHKPHVGFFSVMAIYLTLNLTQISICFKMCPDTKKCTSITNLTAFFRDK